MAVLRRIDKSSVSIDADKIVSTFASFDANKDGTIDMDEFILVLRGLNPTVFTDARIKALFLAADMDDDGRVSYTEFISWLFSEDSSLVGRVRAELGVHKVIPVEDGLQVWLDASMGGTIDLNEHGHVIRWRDLSGGDNDAIPLDDGGLPTYAGNVNGIQSISFQKHESNKELISSLRATHGCTCKTVAFVAQHRTVSNCMMLFAQFQDVDFSIRVDGDGGYRRGGVDNNDFHYLHPEKLWLNSGGNRNNSSRTWDAFPNGPVIIIAVKRAGRSDGTDFIYQLSSRFLNRGFDGSLGEVAIYDRELNDGELEEVWQYLNDKWILRKQLGEAKEKALCVMPPPTSGAVGRGHRGNRRACRWRAECRDKTSAHRSRFSHPGDDDYPKTPCKHGAACYRSDAKHLACYSHPDDGDRRPCPFSVGCFRKQPDHLSKFAHPGDFDYFDVVEKHGGKPAFLTMMECFKYCEFEGKGLIKDQAKLGELFYHLDKPLPDAELCKAWEALEDGKGLCYFPEFVQWANARGINLPLGLEDASGADTNLECGFVGCSCKVYKQAGDSKSGVAFCTCKHKKSLHVAAKSVEDVPNPAYWTSTDLDEVGSAWVPCPMMVDHVQTLVDITYKRTWTRDRGKDKRVPNGYDVRHVFRNENPRLWRKYSLRKELFKKELAESGQDVVPFEALTSIDWTPVDDSDAIEPDINEWFLWHGTSHEGAEAICRIDFKVKLAGTTTGSLYGKGTYFAESITKADEYAKEGDGNPELDLPPGLHCALLCRILGGRVLYNDEVEPPDGGLPLQESCLYGDYDCVVGDREKVRGTFKEYVIFSGDQAYPEYIVYFTRRFD